MKQVFINRILFQLSKAMSKGEDFKSLVVKCKVKYQDKRFFNEVLVFLEKSGDIIRTEEKYFLPKYSGLIKAKIVRLNSTFGFAENEQDQTEIFIPGKFLKGAMPNDIVFIKLIKSRGASPEGEVVKIIQEGTCDVSGVLTYKNGKFGIMPDTVGDFFMELARGEKPNAQLGDKVLTKIVHRGKRHSEHKISIIESFGNSEKASSCAKAILQLNNIPLEFPFAVSDEAKTISKKGFSEKQFQYREDLRNSTIFTIDSADSKDLDDAISLYKMDNLYYLGVHIADVSYYVKSNTDIDKEAFERATSVYYANRVVPMLPKELSNGICSLNPNEDRLTFSAFITLDENGKIVDYDFKKTIINSKMKGVYSEINQILDNSATDKMRQKYKGLEDNIFLMKELADKLAKNKYKRGSPEIDTSESKIIIDENDICVDVKCRERGESERIIEEFMLIANETASMFARNRQVPFVYRVHEKPDVNKLEVLKQTLGKLGFNASGIKSDVSAQVLSTILKQAKFTPYNQIINKQVLRSMAKAKYSSNPIGHFGLVLDDYSHFTSPIRRYPDLVIHRILSDIISGTDYPSIKKRYTNFVESSSKKSTEMEIKSMKVERMCEDCYKAEYMKPFISKEFDGIISSTVSHGIYVELPNTIEGLVKTSSLPKGNYEFDNVMEYKDILTGKSYKIGDKVRVKCIAVNVNSGKIDFEIVE